MRWTSSEKLPRAGSRRGFTFVELCLALVITALVMSAVTSFVLAMSHSWKHNERSDAATLYARQAAARIDRTIQEGRLIGATYSPAGGYSGANPPAVILWITDTNGDGQIQGAECGMLRHDPDNKTLVYYYPGQGDAALPLSWDVFTSGDVLANFPVGRDARPVARNIESVTFRTHFPDNATVSPTLEYRLEVAGQGRTVVEYGTASVRAPARKP